MNTLDDLRNSLGMLAEDLTEIRQVWCESDLLEFHLRPTCSMVLPNDDLEERSASLLDMLLGGYEECTRCLSHMKTSCAELDYEDVQSSVFAALRVVATFLADPDAPTLSTPRMHRPSACVLCSVREDIALYERFDEFEGFLTALADSTHQRQRAWATSPRGLSTLTHLSSASELTSLPYDWTPDHHLAASSAAAPGVTVLLIDDEAAMTSNGVLGELFAAYRVGPGLSIVPARISSGLWRSPGHHVQLDKDLSAPEREVLVTLLNDGSRDLTRCVEIARSLS